jgi:hypothetical protein
MRIELQSKFPSGQFRTVKIIYDIKPEWDIIKNLIPNDDYVTIENETYWITQRRFDFDQNIYFFELRKEESR